MITFQPGAPYEYDPTEALRHPYGTARYLNDAFATRDIDYILKAVGRAFQAQNPEALVWQSGQTTGQLRNSFLRDKNPPFKSVIALLYSLGVEFSCKEV
ncbi:Cro/CI family transcriptional regulator [Alcanivorax sp. S71-1-4]|uniref:hypothetical protein n=1 Tax=Alcanivorax sp. S71-1-4 TaxID=1177159 RepID=UPI0013572AA4|nr:hypothetical protein [Alcanivorax sp. S71-1-4]KAF0806788.1 Cro/CI family transcriptional regulator [Alcanivorax sp. S71-1-4]